MRLRGKFEIVHSGEWKDKPLFIFISRLGQTFFQSETRANIAEESLHCFLSFHCCLCTLYVDTATVARPPSRSEPRVWRNISSWGQSDKGYSKRFTLYGSISEVVTLLLSLYKWQTGRFPNRLPALRQITPSIALPLLSLMTLACAYKPRESRNRTYAARSSYAMISWASRWYFIPLALWQLFLYQWHTAGFNNNSLHNKYLTVITGVVSRS